MLELVNQRSNKEEFVSEEAIANMSKGDVLFSQEKYPQAYQYYYLAKLAAEKSLDPCTYSEYTYRLAMVLYKQSSYLKAADYFKMTFVKSENCKNDFSYFARRQEVLNNTGLSYFKANNLDSAKFYYEKTLSFLDQNERNFQNQPFFDIARGVVYGDLAQIYAGTNFNKAEELYKKSIALNSKPSHDINDALITQTHLANLYFGKERFEDAFNVLSAMERGLDTIKNTAVEIEWNRLMWKYYDQKKDLGQAYGFLNNYENLKAKNTNTEENLTMGNITDVFENLQSEYEISLLTKNDKLNSLYFFILTSSLVLFGVIILLVWYNWRKSAHHVKILQAYSRQINDQKQELQKTIDIVEQQNKEKDRIMRVVAHDLRNPINGIVALLSILDDTQNPTDAQKEILKVMETACFDALKMIMGILETSPTLPDNLQKTSINVSHIVSHVVQLLRYKAEEKGQTINVVSPLNNLCISGNEEQLRRLLSNLITNAVKFSPAGSSINISVAEHKDSAEILVADEGIGIPADLTNKIYNAFTEAKRHGTGNEKPFGLGLSICKQIIDNHRGAIWFRSEENKGTTFHVTLPKK
jgi:signal transduction histidine kinase